MSIPQGSRCNPGSLTSFPVRATSFTVQDTLYTSILSPLSFQFNFTERTTIPNFASAADGLLDEPNTSSLTYLGNTYSLESVQLAAPSHTEWIIPASDRVKNKEDLILTFSASSLLVNENQVIILVIPILRSTTTLGDPAYVAAISNPSTSPGTKLSLTSAIPQRKGELFAYYTTCTPGYAPNTPAQNVLVVVAVQGLYVSSATMDRILGTFTKSSLKSKYDTYQAPATLSFVGTPYAFPDETDFRTRVKTTTDLLPPAPPDVSVPSPGPADQTIDAYKCVPIDPETHIRGGSIRVDPAKGVLLSQVESERQAVIAQDVKTTPTLTPKDFYAHVSTALAVFLAVTLLGALVYILFGTFIGASAVGPGATFFQKFLYRVQEVPGYVITGVLMAFVGFMVGMLAKFS